MCLAIPMRVDTINADGSATVSAGELGMIAALDLVGGVRVGDYVLMHAGFAIQIMGEEEATATIALLDEVADILPANTIHPSS